MYGGFALFLHPLLVFTMLKAQCISSLILAVQHLLKHQIRIPVNERIVQYLSLAVLFVFCIVYPILTIRQIILSHPLTVILSSLGGDLHNSCGATKVHLIPLETVVMARAPGSTLPPAVEIKSAVVRAVISGPA